MAPAALVFAPWRCHPAVMKRLLDLVVAAGALIVLSPILLILYVLVRISLGKPVLFRQMRPGLHGKPFELLKFRSMRDAVDKSGNMLADSERLTPFGRKLRASSLDELPSLVNIIRGDLSLVGPRPLLMQYLPLYNNWQRRRHEVRPGLTGLAQVNGRNAISWDEKFALDVWYVDNRSLLLDLKILAQTLVKVLRRDGITASGEATMPPFSGSIQPEYGDKTAGDDPSN